MLIAVPSVLKIMGNSKKDAFVTQCQSIYKTAEQEYIKDVTDNKINLDVVTYDNTNNPLEFLSENENITYNIIINKEGNIKKFLVKDTKLDVSMDLKTEFENESIKINQIKLNN